MTQDNLLDEWARREAMFRELVAYFTDVRAKSFAEGCLEATRRCRAELGSRGEWIRGYEAGLRSAEKDRRQTAANQSEVAHGAR